MLPVLFYASLGLWSALTVTPRCTVFFIGDTACGELSDRELHMSEKRTRVKVVKGALLLWHAAFHGIYKILTGALEPYDREKSERDEKLSLSLHFA